MMLSHLPSLVWDVQPVAYVVGRYSIRYYGLCMTAALGVGYLLLSWQMRRAGADAEEAADFWCYSAPLTFLGARLVQLLCYELPALLDDPPAAFSLQRGGFASHGAFLGLALAMYWFTRRRAISFLDGTDRLSFSIALAAILIRLGALFNSDVVGKATDGSWGIAFPSFDLGQQPPLRYPTQIYEMLVGAAVLALLLVCDARWRREGRPRGALTGVLLVGYFSGRFLIEFWKEPQYGEPPLLLNIGQLLSIPYLLLGLGLLCWSLRVRHAAGWVVGWKSKA